MQVTSKSCRLCLSESEFNVSLYSNFSRKTNLVEKILVCLKIVTKESDILNTICYKCTENIDTFYNFITNIRKSQSKYHEKGLKIESSYVKRPTVSSYVHEQVFDADLTFSFLEIPSEKKSERKPSSSIFSYFSPQNKLSKRSTEDFMWKTPKQSQIDVEENEQGVVKNQKYKSRNHSADIFESQSQDAKESPLTFDWKLTPDDNIMKGIRNKCFKRSNF